jgi:hypothetical protein
VVHDLFFFFLLLFFLGYSSVFLILKHYANQAELPEFSNDDGSVSIRWLAKCEATEIKQVLVIFEAFGERTTVAPYAKRQSGGVHQ